MLGFECKSILRGADAAAASAGVSGKRRAQQSHESQILESESSVAKKVKRSLSPLREEDRATFSAPISFAERQQSVQSNASAATSDAASTATNTPEQHPATPAAHAELFDYYLSDASDENGVDAYHLRHEAKEQDSENCEDARVRAEDNTTRGGTNGAVAATKTAAAATTTNAAAAKAARGNSEELRSQEEDDAGEYRQYKRTDSATLMAETERLVGDRRGCFARARSAAPVFFGDLPAAAPSCGASSSLSASSLEPAFTDSTLLEVRCAIGHCFDTTLRLLRHGVWCQPCERALARAHEYAASMRGTLVSKHFFARLTFECAQGHAFEVSARDYAQKWCTQCKRDEKQRMKDYLKVMEEQKSREYEERQKVLYDQAIQQNSVQHTKKVQYAAKVVEREVEKLAEQQAQEYMQRDGQSSGVSFAHALYVYKALLYPDQVMQYYYNSLDAESLKQEFRSQMKSLHPDKNLHPRAAEAFQKVHMYYKAAARKFE